MGKHQPIHSSSSFAKTTEEITAHDFRFRDQSLPFEEEDEENEEEEEECGLPANAAKTKRTRKSPEQMRLASENGHANYAVCVKCNCPYNASKYRHNCNVSRNERTATSKICHDCEERRPLEEFTSRDDDPHGRFICKTCEAQRQNENKGTFDGFIRYVLGACRSNSKKRSGAAAICDLSFDDLKQSWLQRDGKCEYSGVPMTHAPNSDFKGSPERHDNSLGYNISNVSWVAAEFQSGHAQWSLDKIKFVVNNHTPTATQRAAHDIRVAALVEATKKKKAPAVRRFVYREVVDGVACFWCNDCETMMHEQEEQMSAACGSCYLNKKHAVCTTLLGCMRKLLASAKGNCTSRQARVARGIQFDLTEAELIHMFRKQNGRCFYSLLPLILGQGTDLNWAVSLERLNTRGGYTKDNCVLVAREFNSADYSAVAIHTNGGCAGWSRAKFQVALCHMQEKFPPTTPAAATTTATDELAIKTNLRGHRNGGDRNGEQ